MSMCHHLQYFYKTIYFFLSCSDYGVGFGLGAGSPEKIG